jgi:hypothetical protein
MSAAAVGCSAQGNGDCNIGGEREKWFQMSTARQFEFLLFLRRSRKFKLTQ